jgi:hypothetical protein
MFDWLGFGLGFIAGSAVMYLTNKYAPAAVSTIKADATVLESKVLTLAGTTKSALTAVRSETAAKVADVQAGADKRLSDLEKAVFGGSRSPTPAAPAASGDTSSTAAAQSNIAAQAVAMGVIGASVTGL